MKLEGLKAMLSKPGCKKSNLELARQLLYGNNTKTALPNPKPERHQAKPLGQAGEGKEEGFQRPVVRFTGYRVRPLDPDNFAGSVKDVLDGLRHAGLIPGDEPWRIRLVTDQVKVRSFEEEYTEITISYP